MTLQIRYYTMFILEKEMWQVIRVLLLAMTEACLCFEDETLTEDDGLGFRIIGGELADLGSCNYQVSLQRRNLHICGGTLVTLEHVITAAHCFVNRYQIIDTTLDLYKVKAGDVDLYSDSLQVRVPYLICLNPSFNQTNFHADVAAIILESPFIATSTLAPIGLAISSPKANTNCRISGWGTINAFSGFRSQTEQKPTLIQRFLRYANISIPHQAACIDNYNSTSDFKILFDMICAGDGITDTCQGDSGGPMVCNGVLTGIVSGGMQCAFGDYPGVYGRIHIYNDWIKNAMLLKPQPQTNGNGSFKKSALEIILLIVFLNIFK